MHSGGVFIYQFLLNEIAAHYDTVALLRRTDRGSITLVRHKKTKTPYVFFNSLGSDAVYRRLMHVSCPYLPQIEEVASDGEHLAVLEEYIEGDNLADLLEGGLPDRREVLKIIRQLCHALWVLHSFGAVHRDVKPENIILRGSDAVLIDFDASRIIKQGCGGDTRVLGTTGYAAPEQFGIGQTDARTDIYSLGVLFNIMLTGLHPSVCMADGLAGHVIQRCTMMNPADRYQNTFELLRALPSF